MTSSSALGYTQITLQFGRNRTVDSAAQDVQAAINATAGELPPNLLNPPIYRKTNPADTPILLIALTSATLPLTKVSDYANSILAQKLSQMPGVGLVTVGGAQNPAIRVQVNPAQLAAQGLDLEAVRSSLANSTVNQPKGTLYGGQHALSLLTNDQMMTAEGFNEYILAYRNGAAIRVRDVGRAVVEAEDRTLAGWSRTQRAVLIQIQRQPGANVIETVEGIEKALPELEASLPPSIKIDIVSDRTQTIRASVVDVQFTLLLTIALVVGVIFLFLRKLWATVIPAVAVPLSLVGTFAVMYVLGFSLDNLSLMALTIAIGFVVDDAIVMIENIVRQIEDGAAPMEAAVKGAGQIGFTILSISISLIAVFIPLFLMSGVIGLLFREFAITVAVSVVVSLVVSLTLTPMMCARLLTPQASRNTGQMSLAVERLFDHLVGVYDRALQVALHYRRVTLMFMILAVFLTLALFERFRRGSSRSRIRE
jgi:HAE1 family hydrophobic/amphiphilic exporter-1